MKHVKHPRPKRFDYNLLVIGAGAGGLISAYIAAVTRAKVALVEKHLMGGDCLNTGCVPSKAIIKAAKYAHQMRHAETFGISAGSVTVDFQQVMAHVDQARAKIAPHDSVERYQSLGVDVIQGEAYLEDPWRVFVNGTVVTAKQIIIATGARPSVPEIEGLGQIKYLTSDSVWNLRSLPERLIVLGGGTIGCELTQTFARLGSNVTQIQRNERLMPKEDVEVSEYIKAKFQNEGVEVLTGFQINRIVQDGAAYVLEGVVSGQSRRILFDQLLIATGRQANVTGFGLEALNIKLNANGTVATDAFLRTNWDHIFAVGDVAGPYQFTHTAGHMAWYASVNALFGKVKRFKVDYSVVPWATFTDPEVAQVGLNEQQALAQGIPYEVTRYELDDLDRAITEQTDEGWIKVLTVPKKDKILGATIVGAQAGDWITSFIMGMRHGLGLNKLLSTIHIYPTYVEGNKLLAGQWKNNRKPERLLSWSERYHRWMRG